MSGEHPGISEDWDKFYREELIPTPQDERENEAEFFRNLNQGIYWVQ